MKKTISILLAVIIAMSSISVISAGAAEDSSDSASISFDTFDALYAHAVANSSDSEAWQAWQSEHNEDFEEINPDVKYFFLPSSADDNKVEIYNAYSSAVTVNGVEIASKQAKTVDYAKNTDYSVKADGTTYTLRFMKSSAEGAIYVNNTNADGNGTELMKYLNPDKSRSAKATGAIVGKDGSIDNTSIKKIKGRGNTTWDKPKKAYNITYDSKVSIAGMSKSKKFSILANYQDDSLSRNRFLYDLSDAVGMPYASDSRYVDFYANGYYWGSYQITEKVEAGSGSLVGDINPEKEYLNEDGTVKEDFPFVCEVDASAGWDDYYTDTYSRNKITIKSPELKEGDPGYDEVLDYVADKFDEFFNAAKSSSKDLSPYADVDSITKIFLINELGKNWDSGVSSLYFTYKQDTDGKYKFFGSPVWDYDNSLGNAYGVESELRNIGVSDYTLPTGWWCQYKGKSKNQKSTSNIMNLLSKNRTIKNAAPKIWFEEFVPAIEHFVGDLSEACKDEFYTSAQYYDLLSGSAEMNYTSGWLLNTGSWIADHTSLKKATFDYATGEYREDSKATKYANDFEGMYNYTADWFTSRAAWISSQYYSGYSPKYEIGDVNMDGSITVVDVSVIQKKLIGVQNLTSFQLMLADIDKSGTIDIRDATAVQKKIVGA